jgi:hypothetical protein
VQNENQSPEAANAENGPDKEVTLNYIDKVHFMFDKTGSYCTRMALTLVIASSLMLTISVGWVSAQEDFSLGGLGLKISFVALLASGIVLIASMYLALYTAFIRYDALDAELLRLYRTQGHEITRSDGTIDLVGFYPSTLLIMLMAPGGSETARHKWARNFETFIAIVVVFGLFFLLPIVAEVAMVVKLASVAGWNHPLVWLPFSVFPAFVALAPVLYIKRAD